MKAKGLLHAELSRLVAALGHGDTLVVGDAGLPARVGVPMIDLAVTRGVPRHVEVVAAILSELVVERGYANEEQLVAAPEVAADLAAAWPDDIPLERIDHAGLKERSQAASAIVRTGEMTPYANVILVAGVPF